MKELKCRPFKFNDIYKAAKILKHIKIDISQSEVLNLGNDIYKTGINVIKNAIAESENAQNEINEFLGMFFELTGEEFGNLSMDESLEAIEQLKNMDGWASFFKKVGDWMK